MSSRMERYYQSRSKNSNRTSRNKELYETIYTDKEYTSVEGVVATPSPNEIDIKKIRELLKSEQIKDDINITKIKPHDVEVLDPLDEEKNYDIRDVLNKAKDERHEKSSQYRSLRNTEYNILKGIKLDEHRNDFKKEAEELKELINTITNTSLLNKLGDRELSLELLNDLRSNTMISDSESIKSIIEEVKNENDTEDEEPQELDNTFYTSSLNFKEKDFEQLQDINSSIQKNNKLITIMLIILIIVIVSVTGFVFYNFLK